VRRSTPIPLKTASRLEKEANLVVDPELLVRVLTKDPTQEKEDIETAVRDMMIWEIILKQVKSVILIYSQII
jgi:hypothetical protein